MAVYLTGIVIVLLGALAPSAFVNAAVTCNGLSATIVGTSAGEILTGTSGDDVFVTTFANVSINGGGGNDTVCATGGGSVIITDAGNDWVQIAGTGNNVNTGAGDDIIMGSDESPNVVNAGGDFDACYDLAASLTLGCELTGSSPGSSSSSSTSSTSSSSTSSSSSTTSSSSSSTSSSSSMSSSSSSSSETSSSSTSSASSSVGSCLPSDIDLTAYWKFDEDGSTALDSTSYNNQGSVIGATSGGAGAPVSFINTAMRTFDGVDDHVTVSDVTGLPSGNAARTITLWVNQVVLQNQSSLVSLGSGNNGDQKFIVMMGSAGGQTYLFTDGINAANNITVTGGEIPAAGWHHIAFAYDGAGNWEYYLDGLLKKSGVFPVVIDTVTNAVVIGARNDVVSGFWNGALDDVRIYNAVLSPSHISALAAGECSDTGGGSSSSGSSMSGGSSSAGSTSSSASSSSENGSSESSSSADSSGNGGGSGGFSNVFQSNGGHRGHNSNVFRNVSQYLLGGRAGSLLPPGGFGGGSVSSLLTASQREALCSIKKLDPASDAGLLEWLSDYFASLTGASPDAVRLFLLTPNSCPSPQSAVPAKESEPIAIRVNGDGYIVSSNPVWNACIKGQASLGLIKSNIDRVTWRQRSVRYSRPLTCSDYHKNSDNVWTHPDFPLLTVKLDHKGRLEGTLPTMYVVQHDPRPVVATEQQSVAQDLSVPVR